MHTEHMHKKLSVLVPVSNAVIRYDAVCVYIVCVFKIIHASVNVSL